MTSHSQEAVVPERLARAALDDPSPARQLFMRSLRDTIRESAERWDLRLGQPFAPGTEISWVAPAWRTSEPLVLKITLLHVEADHEADGLRSAGAVLLHESATYPGAQALLLERCDPGRHLGDVMPEPEQDIVVTSLLRRLWSVPGPDGAFRSLVAMCDQWGDEFEAQLENEKPDHVDVGLAREGIALFRQMPTTAREAVLLCTDLHAQNVLSATREPWLVIDPKPHLGDPAYDLLQHMYNCPMRLAADPAGLAKRLADLAGLETERVAQWLFARCIQESIDHPALYDVAVRLAP